MGEIVNYKVENKLVLETYPKNFLTPSYVFFKIEDGYKLKVTDNSYVYKNDILMVNKDGICVYSSVSGKVLGVKDMLYYNDKTFPSLVIENDYKENLRMRRSVKKHLVNLNLNELITTLKDASLIYKDKNIIDKLFSNGTNKLIVNAISLEPNIGNNYFISQNYYQDILETIDVLSNICSFKEVKLVLNSGDSEIISLYDETIGTYPNIKLEVLSANYPYGMDELVKKNLNWPDASVLSLQEILMIYNALKKQIPTTERFITITGNAVKPRAVIKVKEGTLLSEVFINNYDFTCKLVDVYLNGRLSGKLVKSLKYVIDSNIDGLVINKQENNTPSKCINCGLCLKYCPQKLNPKYVYDHKGNVKPEYKESCLKCGLCNYICPSKIDLLKYMDKECNKIEKELSHE